MQSPFLFRWLLAGALTIITFLGYSQNAASTQADSLLSLLNVLEPSREKCEVYYRLYGVYLYQDTEQAEAYLDEGFAVAKKIQDRRSLILAYDKYGGLAMVRSDYPEAIRQFTLADSLLQYEDWPREQTLIYGNFAAIYKDLTQFDKALEWNQRFIESATAINNQGFLAFGYSLTGDVFHTKGQNELAALNYLKALRIYEEINDPVRLADAFRLLGATQTAFLSFEDAQRNLEKAIKIYEDLNDQFYLAQSYRDLGYNHFLQDQFKAAEAYYQKALFIAETTDDSFGVAEAKTNLGEIAIQQKDYSRARTVFDETLRDYEDIGSPLQIGETYRSIGDANFYETNYAVALKNYRQALETLDPLEVPIAMQAVYQGFYRSYKALGEPELALQAYEKFTTISDSLFTVDKATRMEELQLLYDVDKKDQQIVLLNKDITLRRLRGQLLTLGILAVLFLGVLIVIMQLSRRKKEKKIAAERYRRQQLELEKQQLEKEQLERELAAQVLQLCRKNEILVNVQQEVEDLSRPGGAQAQGLNRLNRTITRSLNSDEDWIQFLSTFEKVHPEFLNHLQASAGKLSPAEQRLACLLRMNLSSKEIATLLNISSQGVKKARYRLRKKLNLDSDINLQSYLLSLDWRASSN